MELGEKLRQARLEASLSQRQLCEGCVTRNMLSLIESGKARPSMDTLKTLAARLGKPVSFFLEEDALISPNQAILDTARRLYDEQDNSGALKALEHYQKNDPVHDREASLLACLVRLELAQQAIAQMRYPYALELLQNIPDLQPYCAEDLSRRKLLLLGRIPGQRVSSRLPSLDEELLLRAEEALAEGNLLRVEHLLNAAESQDFPRWNLLRGKIAMAQTDWSAAAIFLHKAEPAHPRETAPLLEQCYREMENYKKAYEYACRRQGLR